MTTNRKTRITYEQALELVGGNDYENAVDYVFENSPLYTYEDETVNLGDFIQAWVEYCQDSAVTAHRLGINRDGTPKK